MKAGTIVLPTGANADPFCEVDAGVPLSESLPLLLGFGTFRSIVHHPSRGTRATEEVPLPCRYEVVVRKRKKHKKR